MMQRPSQAAIGAWARILRIQKVLLAAVEADLKAAGFPPLAWYDALLELSRAPDGRMTPCDLEQAMLLAQYNLSRLLDRLEAEGLVERLPYPGDRRRQLIALTGRGRALQRRMWPPYADAIRRRLGDRLSDEEAGRLSDLLGKLLDGTERNAAETSRDA